MSKKDTGEKKKGYRGYKGNARTKQAVFEKRLTSGREKWKAMHLPQK